MTLTPTLRLTEPAILGDEGFWPTYLNDDMIYIDRGINGLLSKSIAGLTTYTLIADGSASDEARYQVYTFTGALSADCTVTVPANAKVGLVRNDWVRPRDNSSGWSFLPLAYQRGRYRGI